MQLIISLFVMICRLVVSMRKYYYRCLLESQTYWVQELSIPVQFRARKLRIGEPFSPLLSSFRTVPSRLERRSLADKGSSNQT